MIKPFPLDVQGLFLSFPFLLTVTFLCLLSMFVVCVSAGAKAGHVDSCCLYIVASVLGLQLDRYTQKTLSSLTILLSYNHSTDLIDPVFLLLLYSI